MKRSVKRNRTVLMRRNRLLVTMLICVVFPAALWGQAGPYTVLFPRYITTGEYSGDRDIYAARFFIDGTLEWSSSQPKPLCTQQFLEFAPVTVRDGKGGFYLVYTIEHRDSLNLGDRDILLRHLDNNGNDVWGDSTNNVVVVARSRYIEQNPKLVLAADGSLTVIYEVQYKRDGTNGDVDIAAYRIGADGAPVWESAVWLAKSKRHERLAAAVEDGHGGAIAVLEVSDIQGDTVVTNSDIMAVHVDALGETMWGATADNGAIPIAASKHLEKDPDAVGDGFGGVYIAYEIEYASGARAGDIDILAQHLSSIGVREWTDGAFPPIVSSNSQAIEKAPRIALDSAGIVVSFEILFHDEKMPLHLVGAQRLNHLGKPMWNDGKKARLIGIEGRIPRAPVPYSGSMGGTYIVMEALDTATNDCDIYAQMLDSDGGLLWGDGEYAIPVLNSANQERNITGLADAFGGLIVVGMQMGQGNIGDTMVGDSTVVAQRVTMDGSFPWGNGSLPLVLAATSASQDTVPTIVANR